MIMHISAMSNSGFGSEDSHTMAVVFVTFLCVGCARLFTYVLAPQVLWKLLQPKGFPVDTIHPSIHSPIQSNILLRGPKSNIAITIAAL